MRKMKAKLGNVGARLKLNGVGWPIVTCLFPDDTVLLAESERETPGSGELISQHMCKKEVKGECWKK